MNLTPRVKFSAALDAGGLIVAGAAAVGFSTLDPASDAFQYLLEDDAGNWEIGHHAPSTGRKPQFNSGSNFDSSTAGLKCSVVATPDALVNSSPQADGSMGAGPLAHAPDCLSVGRGAVAGSLCKGSTTVGIEASADTYCPGSTALGFKARSKAPNGTALGLNATVESTAGGGCAIGVGAYAVNPGEIAIGHPGIPNGAFIPVSAPIGADAGGTFEMQGFFDPYDAATYTFALADIDNLTKRGTEGTYWSFAVRVKGTIYCGAASEDDGKAFDVDYMILSNPSSATYSTLHSTFTVLSSGANNVAYALLLGASKKLQITVPSAIDGLLVTGLLQVTNIPLLS